MKLTGRSSLELWSWVFGDESCYEMKFIWTFFGLTAYDGIRVFLGGPKDQEIRLKEMLLPWVGWKGLERGNPRADPIKEDCLVVLTCSNMLQPIPNVNIQVNIESTTGIFVPSSSYGHPLATYLADNFNPQEIELLETINHPKGRTQFLKPQTINRQNNRCKIMSIFGDVPTAPIEYIETAAKTCLLNQSSASFLLKKMCGIFSTCCFYVCSMVSPRYMFFPFCIQNPRTMRGSNTWSVTTSVPPSGASCWPSTAVRRWSTRPMATARYAGNWWNSAGRGICRMEFLERYPLVN